MVLFWFSYIFIDSKDMPKMKILGFMEHLFSDVIAPTGEN